MDDTGWWGNAWLQAYEMTGNTSTCRWPRRTPTTFTVLGQHLRRRRVVEHLQNYKNAIPNELFLELTAGLHNAIPGDTKYLGWANSE